MYNTANQTRKQALDACFTLFVFLLLLRRAEGLDHQPLTGQDHQVVPIDNIGLVEIRSAAV